MHAKTQKAHEGKLIIALMYKDRNILEKAKKVLAKKFGPIESEGIEYNFDFTDYYEEETGKNLLKKFISFEKLIRLNSLPGIRIFTEQIEEQLSVNGKRQINIDPGYITLDNMVVATKKRRSFKIYLDKGVFGHLMLMFKKNDCITFPHTFPDYKLKENIDFFISVRNSLKGHYKKDS